MTLARKTLRNQLFLTTAASALVAMSSAANAQLVRSGDLNSARNSSGNPGQLTVTDTSATQTDMRVESKVVVADWTSFNVPTGTTVNVTAGGTLTTATLLNRVIGANFSDISGTINAAAINFWLINQNGILFGDGASINAASFFASTLNVSDQDFFDFYEGTDLAGNGSGTINFGAGFNSAIVGGGPNTTFITDGSLVFASDQINLSGAFDAQSGRAAFIAANNVDVTFTPGSPLSYTVNAGTVVASALRVGGSVEGQSVQFAMFTAQGVTGTLLRVDADVTANAAIATDTGIALRAEGLGVSTADTLINGTFTSTGRVNLLGDGELLANADITGSFIDLDFGNALQTRNLTSTVGGVQLDASGAITTGDVSAATFASINSTGGSVTTGNVVTNGPGASLSLRAGGAASDITTGTVNSNGGDILLSAGRDITTGAIATSLMGAPTGASIGLHAGGSVTAGQIDAGEDLRADASGNFTATGITAGDDVLLNIGGLATVGDITTDGDGIDTFAFTFGGPAGASSLLFSNETTPGSDIVINSGAANLGALSATDDITVRTSGAITLDSALADNDASGAGNLSVRSSGSSVDIAGHAEGATVSLRAADSLNMVSVSATGGDAFFNGASVTATGLVEATNDVSVQTNGAVSLAAVTADSDADLVGDVLIGTALAPSIVNIGGPVSGAAIDIDSAGGIFADAAGVTLTSSVGDVSLTAVGDVRTGPINSATAIDIDSSGGGQVRLANLVAGGNVLIDTTGAFTIDSPDPANILAVDAVGQFLVGQVGVPSGISIVGDVRAANIAIDTTGRIGGDNFEALSGSIDIESTGGGNVLLRDLTAALGNVSLSGAQVRAGSILAGGALTIGAAEAILDGDATAADIDIDVTQSLIAQALTATAGNVDIFAQHDTSNPLASLAGVRTGAISATGDVGVRASGLITLESALADSDADAAGNLVVRSSGSRITISGDAQGATVSLRAAEALRVATVSATGGDAFLNGASVTASGLVKATNNVSVQSPGAVKLAAVTADSDKDLVGDVLIGTTIAPTSIAISGATSGANVRMVTPGTITSGDITGTFGDVRLNATGAVKTGDLIAAQNLTVRSSTSSVDINGHAEGIVVSLRAAEALTTGTVTATGGDAFLNGASVTASGLVQATNNVSVQSAGAVSLAAVTADSDSDMVGDVLIGTSIAPSSIAISGSTSGASVRMVASGTPGSIATDDITSTVGNVQLDATGAITTGDLTAAQNLTVRSSTSSVDINGHAEGVVVSLRAAQALDVGSVSATGGDAFLNGASVTATGLVEATNNVSVQSAGAVSLAAVTADSDNDTNGDVLIGTTIQPSSIAISGATSGENVTILSTGAIGTGDLTAVQDLVVRSSGSSVDVNGHAEGATVTLRAAEALEVDTVSATGGDAFLNGASVTASGLIEATNDVSIQSPGAVSLASVTADSDDDMTGDVLIGTTIEPSSIVIADATSGAFVRMIAGSITAGAITSTFSGIDLDATGAITTGDLDSATRLDVDSTGGSVATGNVVTRGAGLGFRITMRAGGATSDISTGTLNSNGGDMLLSAGRDITTAAIATSLMGAPTAASIGLHAGGSITTGQIDAGEDLRADAAGDFTATGITAGDDVLLNIGGLATVGDITTDGLGIDTFSFRFNGPAGASSLSFDTENPSTFGSDIVINSGSADLGALSAADDITVRAPGAIKIASALANNDSIDGGSLVVRSSGSTVNILGHAEGVAVSLRAAEALTTGTVTATGGDAFLNGGSVTASGLVQATNNVSVQSAGAVSLAAVTADSDNDTNGDILIGTTIAPSSVSLSGPASGAAIDIDSAGAITANLAGVDLTSTVGRVSLTAVGDIRTGAIDAATAIDIDSTGGGQVRLANLEAGTDILIDTTGALTINSPDPATILAVDAGGQFLVGQVGVPSGISIVGDVRAANIAIDTTGRIGGDNFEALSGSIDIESTGGGNVLLRDLTAALGNVSLSGAQVRAGSILAGGALTIGAAEAILDGDATAADIDIDVTQSLIAQALTATAGNVDIFAQHDTSNPLASLAGVRTGAISATGDVGVRASGLITLESALADSDADAAGNLVVRSSGSRITISGDAQGATVSLRAAEALRVATVSATGGDAFLNGASVTASGLVKATNNVSVQSPGAVKLAAVTADSDKDLVGDVLIGTTIAPTSIAISGATSGANVRMIASGTPGSITSGNITSTFGNVQLDATGALKTGDVNSATFAQLTSTGGSVTTGNVVTNGPGSSLSLRAGGAASDIKTGTLNSNSGDMLVSAGRNITTGDIATALVGAPTGASIGLHAGGSIKSGQIDAGEDLRADASGNFTATGITAGDDVLLNIGGLATVGDITTDGDGIDTFAFTFGGPAGASSLLFSNETTPGSDIVINSGAANLGALSATDDITVRSTGAIVIASAVADKDLSDAGNLSVRSSTSSVDINGHAEGVVVSLRAAEALDVGSVSATGGDAFLNGASVTATGLVQATDDVSVQSAGAVSLAAVTADSDTNMVGDVLIGTTIAPSSVILSGPASGAAIDIVSAGAITANTPGVDLTSTVGRVSLTAGGDIRTGPIDAATVIDIGSTGGGQVRLANLEAGTDILIDTTGALTINSPDPATILAVDAGGQFLVGQAAAPSGISIKGDVRASNIDIDTTGAMGADSFEALTGSIDIESTGGGNLSLLDLIARDNVFLTTTGQVRTRSIMAGILLDIEAGAAILEGNATAADIDIEVTKSLRTQALTATAGDVDILAQHDTSDPLAPLAGVRTQAISATGNINVDATGLITIASALADSDLNSSGNLRVAGGGIVIEGQAKGVDIRMTSGGSLQASLSSGSVVATGGDAVLLAAGNIATGAITARAAGAVGGSIDVESTGGRAELGALVADRNISLDAANRLSTASITAGRDLLIGTDRRPTAVTIGGNAVADKVTINTSGGLSALNVTARNGNLTVDAGSISAPIGAFKASGAIDLDVGTNAEIGSLDAGTLIVARAGGLFDVNTTLTSGANTTITAGDVEFGGAATIKGGTLTLNVNAGRTVSLGDAPGKFSLTDAELDRIIAANLVLNGNGNDIRISNVSFDADAGSSKVIIGTTGSIHVVGDVTGSGSGRLFRLGGRADDTTDPAGPNANSVSLARRITVDIEDATLNFGDATLDLRANDIVFGQTPLITGVAGLNPSEITLEYVGNAASLLYSPRNLGGDRVGDQVYLRAGNLRVSYGGSALFQNSASFDATIKDFAGVVLGQSGNTGTLLLNPTVPAPNSSNISDITNAFALFGQINDLVGPAAALAGNSVIAVNADDELVLPASRINGCIIGSGADCLTTIIGTTKISVPREAISLITADERLIVPFDPLVGTNNEGLFSDATTQPGDECEVRDENGVCVG